jgi:hypothetical protein
VQRDPPLLLTLAFPTNPVDDEGVEHVDSSAGGRVEPDSPMGTGLPMARAGRVRLGESTARY